MSYIGRNINNLSDRAKLDSISTSATATFNLLLNSVAYVPSSAESLTVSLNGIIQAPTSSYTVSGSTIIFASNLSSSDVIDFILAERAITLTTIGSGTVTTSNIVDANVTTAKIADNAVTVGKISIPDNAKLNIGTGNDLEIYHDGTNSNIANKTGTLKVATETSGVPITLGHTTSLVTVADNVSVTGDIFLGTTSATNSAKMTSLFSRISHIGFVSENNGGNDDTEHFRFKNGNGTIGNIVAGNTATSYNTSSDYRLKENVDYTFDATTRLKQLKPARFNFIADADKTVDGFIAHEVSSVVPEAIYGDKDGLEKNIDGTNTLDDDGNTIPKYQGIDQSKLVPLLVKTIQELEARITELENA